MFPCPNSWLSLYMLGCITGLMAIHTGHTVQSITYILLFLNNMAFPFRLQCLNAWPVEVRKTLSQGLVRVTPASLYVGRSKNQEAFLISHLGKLPEVCSAHKDLSLSQLWFGSESRLCSADTPSLYWDMACRGAAHSNRHREEGRGSVNWSSLQPTSSTSCVLNEVLRGVSCAMTGLRIRSPMPEPSQMTRQCTLITGPG